MKLKAVTRKDLFKGLQILGLNQGDYLIVHSSLSSFGRLDGGAKTLISVIQEIITPTGLIMMPTFTYGREPFDIKTTPSQTGRVTEVFRTSTGVLRSKHPTHSIAAWGNKNESFVSGHSTESAFCLGSPLHRLAEAGGKILLIGVGHTSNSMFHVAQEIVQVAYLDRPKIVKIVEDDGSISAMKVRRAGCSLGFYKIENFLDESKINKVKIGNSNLQYFLAQDVIKTAVGMLMQDQEALLCDNPDCYACNEARAMIRQIKG